MFRSSREKCAQPHYAPMGVGAWQPRSNFYARARTGLGSGMRATAVTSMQDNGGFAGAFPLGGAAAGLGQPSGVGGRGRHKK